MEALVPFANGTPTRRASYWTGCEIITGADGIVRVAGPHGIDEYPAGTDLRRVTIPAHWPRPVEPAEWDDEITAATRARWQSRAGDMEATKIADVEVSTPRRAPAPAPVAVSAETRDALTWLADPANDRATIATWEAQCAAAGLEWPADGLKAEKIAAVRNDAAALALELGVPWGAP